jgi:hypothetical protein
MTADGNPITNGGVYDYAAGTFAPSTMTLNYGENSAIKTSLPSSQSSTISYVAHAGTGCRLAPTCRKLSW